MKPILLALSTFRQSDKAEAIAIEKAKEGGRRLVVAHIVDVNLARYLIGTDLGLFSELTDQCEREILKQHEERAKQKVDSIAARAERQGVAVNTYVGTGRFGLQCLAIMRKEEPELVITTRSQRPQWVKKLFGSPVDYLMARANCPVVEA
jgi:nucleotide-binding universal stress UspA family protein